MRKHVVVIGIAVAGVTAALLTPPLRAAGAQGDAAESYEAGDSKAKTTTAKIPAKPATIKHLADGTPDIRGAWLKQGGGLNEANLPTDTKLKAFGVLAEPQGFGQGVLLAGPGGKQVDRGRGPVQKYAPNPRPPVGIVDPPDRTLPYTPDGLARRLDYAKNVCCPAKSLYYIELSMRCIPGSPTSGGNMYITQRPGEIAFLFEGGHQSRIIYTDGRPRPASNVTFHGGYSLGKWQGNTLTVETTNLDGRIHFSVGGSIAPFTKDLTFTEHYNVVSDKLITYDLIYTDLKTFTKPIKVAGYMFPPDENAEEYVPENSCHEGSYALWDTFGF